MMAMWPGWPRGSTRANVTLMWSITRWMLRTAASSSLLGLRKLPRFANWTHCSQFIFPIKAQFGCGDLHQQEQDHEPVHNKQGVWAQGVLGSPPRDSGPMLQGRLCWRHVSHPDNLDNLVILILKLLHHSLAPHCILHGQLRPSCSPDQHHLPVRLHDAERVRGEDYPSHLRHAQHDRVPHGSHGEAAAKRYNIHHKLRLNTYS